MNGTVVLAETGHRRGKTDVDGDCHVGTFDLLILLGNWGQGLRFRSFSGRPVEAGEPAGMRTHTNQGGCATIATIRRIIMVPSTGAYWHAPQLASSARKSTIPTPPPSKSHGVPTWSHSASSARKSTMPTMPSPSPQSHGHDERRSSTCC